MGLEQIGVKTAIFLAFVAASGLLMVLLGCVLDHIWYPLWSTFLFICGTLPAIINNRRLRDEPDEACPNFSTFFTSLFFVSGVGLNVTFLHAEMIFIRGLALSIPGGVLLFAALYFYVRNFVAPEES